MENKKTKLPKYETPELNVLRFEKCDVIMTSGEDVLIDAGYFE